MNHNTRLPCTEHQAIYDTTIDLNAGDTYWYAVQKAKQLCAQCPIYHACLHECITNNREQAGVVAGLTLEERTPGNRRNCHHCGNRFVVPKRAPNKIYCSTYCGNTATRLARHARTGTAA